jgi:hypothetical protein
MTEEWTQGEVDVLIRHGAKFSDDHLAQFFLNRTSSSIKHKRQRLGICKSPTYADRIAVTEKAVAPGVVDLARSPTMAEVAQSGLTPEEERNQVLFMFLSKLDEYPPETLDMVENALEVAHRGWALLHGD